MDLDAIIKSSTYIARRNKYLFLCQVYIHTSLLQFVKTNSFSFESINFHHIQPTCFNSYMAFQSLHINFFPLASSIWKPLSCLRKIFLLKSPYKKVELMLSCLISMSCLAAMASWAQRDVRAITSKVISVKSTPSSCVDSQATYPALCR